MLCYHTVLWKGLAYFRCWDSYVSWNIIWEAFGQSQIIYLVACESSFKHAVRVLYHDWNKLLKEMVWYGLYGAISQHHWVSLALYEEMWATEGFQYTNAFRKLVLFWMQIIIFFIGLFVKLTDFKTLLYCPLISIVSLPLVPRSFVQYYIVGKREENSSFQDVVL